MPKKVRIPTPLRKLTNNEELVEINAATVGEAIAELQSRFPGIQERLVDEKSRFLSDRRRSECNHPRSRDGWQSGRLRNYARRLLTRNP